MTTSENMKLFQQALWEATGNVYDRELAECTEDAKCSTGASPCGNTDRCACAFSGRIELILQSKTRKNSETNHRAYAK